MVAVGRTYPEISDLELTFQDLGINLSELGDYLNQVDHVPFAHKLPAVPQARPPDLHFPKPNSRELAEREEHVYDYLPPMHPEWEGEELPKDEKIKFINKSRVLLLPSEFRLDGKSVLLLP